MARELNTYHIEVEMYYPREIWMATKQSYGTEDKVRYDINRLLHSVFLPHGPVIVKKLPSMSAIKTVGVTKTPIIRVKAEDNPRNLMILDEAK